MDIIKQNSHMTVDRSLLKRYDDVSGKWVSLYLSRQVFYSEYMIMDPFLPFRMNIGNCILDNIRYHQQIYHTRMRLNQSINQVSPTTCRLSCFLPSHYHPQSTINPGNKGNIRRINR